MDTDPSRSEPLRILLALTALLTTTGLTLGAVVVAAGGGAARADVPVLGSPAFMEPYGAGWGTAHPAEIYNGGDPAGDASGLVWTRWGEQQAYGHGHIPIFRPGGGYYRRPGAVVLRAGRLGTCPDGTYGYTRLWFRVAHRPDGPVGEHWHAWSGDPDIWRGRPGGSERPRAAREGWSNWNGTVRAGRMAAWIPNATVTRS